MDFSDLSIEYYTKFREFPKSVGSYSIIGRTITADVPIGLYVWGMRVKLFEAHFTGTLKNSDTILDWRMVPPYPKAPKKFNGDFKDLIAPKMLYFMESKELLGLDSLYRQRLREEREK